MRGLHLTDADSDDEELVNETPAEQLVYVVGSQPIEIPLNRKRKPKFDPTDILPVEIDADGRLIPSTEVANRILYYFRQLNDLEGVTWKLVTVKTKNFYWGEFQKYITHHGFEVEDVKKAWEKKAAKRYTDWMSNMSKLEQKPAKGIEKVNWDAWTKYWKTENFKKKSERASNNRNVMAMEWSTTQNKEGKFPDPAEFHRYTHSRIVDNEIVFCDEKASQVNADYKAKKKDALLELQSQAEASGSEVPTELPVSLKALLFKEAAGGEVKGAVYGSGTAATEFYCLKRKGSSFSRRGSSGPSSEVMEMGKKVVDLEEKLARANEDRDNAIAEAVARVSKERDKAIAEAIRGAEARAFKMMRTMFDDNCRYLDDEDDV